MSKLFARGYQVSSHRTRRAIGTAAVSVAALGLVAPVAFGAPASTAGHPDLKASRTTPAGLGLSQNTALQKADIAGQTLSLITGQQVRLASAGAGQYAVTQVSADAPNANDGGAAQLSIRSTTSPTTHVTSVTAVPTYAQELVTSGKVDPHLFDLTYLARNGYGGSTIPVTVHYTAAASESAVEQRAAALPASSYIPGSATTTQATVDVPLATSRQFWASVTHTQTADPATPQGAVWYHNPNAPQSLDAGISAITLDGAASEEVKPSWTVPTYSFSVKMHAPEDPRSWCKTSAHICFARALVIGLTGPATGKVMPPSTVTCDTACNTIHVRFDLPAGAYHFDSYYSVTRNDKTATVLNAQLPEVSVGDDTSSDIYADNASFTTLKTPKDSQSFGASMSYARTLPDGTVFSGFALHAGGNLVNQGIYLEPTKPVTIGSFNLQTTQLAIQPQITMTAPKLSLSPEYESGAGTEGEYTDNGWDRSGVGQKMIWFPEGTHKYEVVDVGYGTTSDFAGKDLRGKIALIREDTKNGPLGGCGITTAPLNSAAAAGAVGAIEDLTDPWSTENAANGGCLLSQNDRPEWFDPKHLAAVPPIPWVQLAPLQAQQLKKALVKRPVTLTVTSHQSPSYIYTGMKTYAGSIPSDTTITLTKSNMITENTTFHASPETRPFYPKLTIYQTLWEHATLGSPDYVNPHSGSPWNVSMSYGPTTPDALLTQTWTNSNSISGTVVPRPPSPNWSATRVTVPAHTKTSSVEYNQAPLSIGAPQPDPSWGIAGRYGTGFACALCVQGNKLMPVAYAISGASASGIDAKGAVLGSLMSNGVTIPFDWSTVSWALPAGTAPYTLTSHGTDADDTWKFTAGPAMSDRSPAGVFCQGELFFGWTSPCATTPMVFLRYIAPVDGDNRAQSGTKETLSVTAYHQNPDDPAIKALDLSVSFDRGTTWSKAQVTPASTAGTYTVTFMVPALDKTNGYVSLRTNASDAAGNSVDETLYDSYPLK